MSYPNSIVTVRRSCCIIGAFSVKKAIACAYPIPQKQARSESVRAFLIRKAGEWQRLQLQTNLNNDAIPCCHPFHEAVK
jgi:hypothetical protein